MDEGFPPLPGGRPPFEKGVVEVLPGAPALDLAAQEPVSAAEHVSGLWCVGLSAASIVGLLYLAGKATLVLEGHVALVRSTFTGAGRILGPGFHILSTWGCEVRKFSATDPVMQLGNVTVVRVLPGDVALALRNGAPLLLGPGVHIVNDPLFKYQDTASMTAPVIKVGNTVHVITVPPGQLGVATADAQGHILGPGRHAINHARFNFLGLASATTEHLEVGSKHRIVIPAGRLGLAWDAGRSLILEPTNAEPLCVDNAAFRYAGSVPATQQVILHGSIKVITVRQGFVGVA